MNDRRQLNIRLDNEPELYEAIKEQSRRMNTSVTALIVAALKSSLEWQMPFDAATLLKRIQIMETEINDLRQSNQRLEEQMLMIEAQHYKDIEEIKQMLLLVQVQIKLDETTTDIEKIRKNIKG
jgi:hypothetical protein